MNKIELKHFITIAIWTNLAAVILSMNKFTPASVLFMMLTSLVLMLSTIIDFTKPKDNQEE